MDPRSPKPEAKTPPPAMPPGPRVDTCVCTGVSFEDIKRAAGASEAGLLEAHKATGCGGKCGLCLPYIKLVLMTGETSLPVMWADDLINAGVNPGRIKMLETAIKRQQAEMDRAQFSKNTAAPDASPPNA